MKIEKYLFGLEMPENNYLMAYKMFNKKNYEYLSESLQTSEEILYAIEIVTGVELESTEDDHLCDNDASYLWEEGGHDDEILAALPTENAQEGKEIFWGASGVFAEFDGEKWILK